jgi:hypothetical protein
MLDKPDLYPVLPACLPSCSGQIQELLLLLIRSSSFSQATALFVRSYQSLIFFCLSRSYSSPLGRSASVFLCVLPCRLQQGTFLPLSECFHVTRNFFLDSSHIDVVVLEQSSKLFAYRSYPCVHPRRVPPNPLYYCIILEDDPIAITKL